MNKDKIIFRIRVSLGIIFLLFSFIFIRLFYLQIIKHDFYINLANNQYQSPKTNSFDRGDIFFQSKTGELLSAASKRTAYTLSISPKDIKDKDRLMNSILTVYPELNKEEFLIKVSKKNDPYEEIAKKLTLNQKNKLDTLRLKGVHLEPEYYRVYPYKSLASHIVGFVGFDKNSILSGRYGLERFYNDVLSRDEEGQNVNFFAEIFADLNNNLFSSKEHKQGDLVLTIDPNVEAFIDDELKDLKEKWKNEESGIIVMDPNTGKIIAMAASPSFDPNNLKGVNVRTFINPMVENVYEMGSIIKPITVAAGLDSKAINTNTFYYDTGDLIINGRHVRNYDGKARGSVNIQEILSQSLNVGTVFVARQMGGDKFKKYMLSFGLGEETGIDLPNEATPLVDNLDSRIEVDYLTTAFGQGMAISPIQTVRALAVLGNGGKMITPYTVDKINYEAGSSKTIVQNEAKQIISKEASEDVTRMLVKVVDTALKGGTYKLEEYSVAAKTGTAQIARPYGGYYDDRYLHSFFGYFPAYDPKFIVFLFHTNPKGAEYASDTLTDSFFKITKFLLSYYEVTPDRPKK